MEQWDSVLQWPFRLSRTSLFYCIDIPKVSHQPKQKKVFVDITSGYTNDIVHSAIEKREWCSLLADKDEKCAQNEGGSRIYQFCEFELIGWERVLNGKDVASAYVVRKGLSRKAQLALQTKKYIAKRPNCLLKNAMPFTMIVETWDAFEDDIRMDFGMGAIATFDTPGLISHSSLTQKLAWILDEVKEVMTQKERSDWLWILKPSVVNKGADIAVISSWENLLDKLEDVPDIREWVLQKYVPNPLTIEGYKFHIRVYVLCVGALKVYVYDDMLLLLAAHK